MPYFFKTIIITSILVGALLGLWCLSYQVTYLSLVFVAIILGIVAYSSISLKMHQRKCFAKCYLNSESFLARLLSSRIMVSLIYFIISVCVSVSIAYSVLDYKIMMWGLVFINIIICATIFSVCKRMLKSIIKEDYLMLLSREISIGIGTFIFIVLSCYIQWHTSMPNYLQPSLMETIKEASNSIYSSCDYIDYFLKFKKSLESLTWWGMLKAETIEIDKRFIYVAWGVFIFYNALSGIAITRLMGQIIYWLSEYFRKNNE
ncbi:hypothetical protein [Helicobacter cetorum]|uniref:hypothetical protein n=1 Tax=Helicobacter cetorum TaxID=138563 RepID=UPI000CF1C063|nr:hypothetical protein [Helicobacter cetorum]